MYINDSTLRNVLKLPIKRRVSIMGEIIETRIENEATDDIIILKLIPSIHAESYLEAKKIYTFLNDNISSDVYHELLRLMFNNEFSRNSVFKIEIK